MGRAPPLFRLARVLRILGVVALVAILVYVGAAAYSASMVRLGGLQHQTSATVAGSVVTVLGGIYVDNEGFLALTDLGIVSYVSLPGGSLLGRAASPTISVSAGENASVPIGITIDLAASPGAEDLLTHNAQLPTVTFANVTFAGITTLAIVNLDNYSWGAPFQSLNVTPSAPTVNSNGSTTFQVRITYQNAGVFDEVGTFSFTLRSSAGATCATGSLPVNTPSGAAFDQTLPITVPASCSVAGGTVDATFSGGGFDVTLPAESLP